MGALKNVIVDGVALLALLRAGRWIRRRCGSRLHRHRRVIVRARRFLSDTVEEELKVFHVLRHGWDGFAEW